ncbi:MAG: SPFH domain-containing protein [Bryobacteraceae bacterium]|nr:SPFH domain-containing protein [Bryobacteraceae bacterium]
MLKERVIEAWNGIPVLVLSIAVLIASIAGLIWTARHAGPEMRGMLVAFWIVVLVLDVLAWPGFFTVQPNQGVVLMLFGRYVGTVRQPGLRFANPFYTKKHVSLRVRNFETSKMKVNDQDGNPIEIAAVVVWKVVDTAEAIFQVDNYEDYVHVQSEAAVRNLATAYPYDAHEEHQVSLRGSTAEVAARLKEEIQERLAVAGVDVIEARISYLAYAPEIAAAMLRRQQAAAVIAARQKIVEGAVGMVEMALEMLARRGVIQLDGEQRAAMVQNLLVVLCGEAAAQPVLNTGTIYQ